MTTTTSHETPVLHHPAPSPRRRLSVKRVLVALVLAAVWGAAAAKVVTGLMGGGSAPAPLVAPYVDATLTPLFAFEDPAVLPAQPVVLGFVVADPTTPCTPSWGGYHTLDEARTALDMDRRIVRFRQRGGDAIVSFGGVRNTELAVGCTNQASLEAAYRSVVDRYAPAAIDMDLEGASLGGGEADAAIVRRARALASVQRQRKAAGTPLDIWLTLPVGPEGLSPEAFHALDATLAEGVDLAGVNVMTMNYGSSRDRSQSMLEASTAALKAVHAQVVEAWRRSGTELRSEQAWARIGATPMIGRNDTPNDRFELADARGLVSFAADNHLGRLSMWSLNRDRACGANADPGRASDLCSGSAQRALDFSTALAKLPAKPVPAAASMTGAGTRAGTGSKQLALLRAAPQADDPATSPYPVWREDRAYTKGQEVVWHRNVYQAKWWTQGEDPDAPAAVDGEAWSVPWRLIGPVLPGDRPVAEAPTLAPGTYPDWSASQPYEKGQRVLLNGHPYEAKWWTQGDAPDADVANAWDAPWQPVTAHGPEPVAGS